MATYDFTSLSPTDFESLTHDLLEREFATSLQAFATGRDGGIDLRSSRGNGNDLIVQCKHYVRSGYSSLKSHLKKEATKLPKISPKRYVLVTSVCLTPQNVDELHGILSPYCLNKHDVIGGDNLNAFIRKYPEVERSHFKLWLSSEAVLTKVLNNDVFIRTCLSIDEIKRRLALYVPTAALTNARQQLSKDRVCVIAGVPGVGKTTLAEMLLTEFIEQDWEVVKVEQNISEALRSYTIDPASKQVIYYDDFLGQISAGEKLAKNEDQSLINLMRTISRSSNKRLILTTREYILAQAKANHEHLSRSNIDIHKFVVKCEDYTEFEKARILANHLYFYGVPQEHIAALVEKKRFRPIISHQNYNPRIVEWMTAEAEVGACTPSDYPGTFLARLNDPTQLWKHAFEQQLSEAAKAVLLSLVSCGSPIHLSSLQDAYESFFSHRAAKYGVTRKPNDFKNALDELEGNFVHMRNNGSAVVVSLHNPSVADFLVGRLKSDLDDATDLLSTAVWFEQINRILNVFEGTATAIRKIDVADFKRILIKVFSAKPIELFPENEKSKVMHCRLLNQWERLRILIMICKKSGMNQLSSHLEEMVVAQLTSFNHGTIGYFDGFEYASGLLSTVEASGVFSAGFVASWRYNQKLWMRS